jgi:hypothetical protein
VVGAGAGAPGTTTVNIDAGIAPAVTSVRFVANYGSPGTLYERLLEKTPRDSGTWETTTLTADPEAADYTAIINRPPEEGIEAPPEERILFCREPPLFGYCDWSDVPAAHEESPATGQPLVQEWWVDRTYDELKRIAPEDVPKTRSLSWIVTDKGRIDNPIVELSRRAMLRAGIRKHRPKPIDRLWPHVTDGHILRMDFLDRLVDSHPELLDLYGRGEFSGPHYHGEVEDKWDALSAYRYSLSIENYEGPHYFSEKVVDALLAWCMPIYWGCTNLGDYFPEDSYVRIDIEDPDAPSTVEAIVESDVRERNLDAIAEARRRVLDEYQYLPRVHRAVQLLEGAQPTDLA